MSSSVTFLFLQTLSSRNLSHGINSNLEFAQITLVLFSHINQIWKRHKNNFKLPSPWWWQRSQKWSPSDVDDNRVGGHLAMEATRRREAGEPRMRFAPNSWAVALHPLNHNHHHVISWYGQSSELRIWPHNTQCVHWSVFPQGCWTLNISEKMLVYYTWTYFC